MGGMLGRLPPAAAEALAAPLGELQAAAVEAVAPTFRAMVDAGEELLLQMHATPAYTAGADGAPAGGAAAVTDTSPCVRDLGRLLAHCRLEYLTKFNPSPASPVPSGACPRAGLAQRPRRCAAILAAPQELPASPASACFCLCRVHLPVCPALLARLQWAAPWWSAWPPGWCCLPCGTPRCCARCRRPASCSWQRWGRGPGCPAAFLWFSDGHAHACPSLAAVD